MSKDDAELVITPIPALIDLLSIKEREKGSPLTEAEVLEIRDTAVCIALSRARRIAMDEARGYADLDPGSIWEQWQAVRRQWSGEQPA